MQRPAEVQDKLLLLNGGQDYMKTYMGLATKRAKATNLDQARVCVDGNESCKVRIRGNVSS